MKRRWPLGLVGLVVALAGCDGQDADRLARLGRKVADKVAVSATDRPAGLSSPLQSIRGNVTDLAIDAKVLARLRWDRELEGATLLARSNGNGVIELSGTVEGLTQRQRAMSLARSTVGVTDVIDKMTEGGEGR